MRGAVHIQTDVTCRTHLRFTRVQSHAHAHLRVGGPVVTRDRALCVRRRADGIAGARERDEERIALRVQLAPAEFGERRAQQLALVGQHPGVLVAQLLEQLRRAFDIAEQKSDGAGWNGTHTRR